MGQTNRRASAWPSLAVLLAVLLSAMQPAIADDTPEREQLAALARQLDLIDRLAEHAAHTAPQERARYHFDYRSEEHTSELQSLMRISYAVFCLKKTKKNDNQ